MFRGMVKIRLSTPLRSSRFSLWFFPFFDKKLDRELLSHRSRMYPVSGRDRSFRFQPGNRTTQWSRWVWDCYSSRSRCGWREKEDWGGGWWPYSPDIIPHHPSLSFLLDTLSSQPSIVLLTISRRSDTSGSRNVYKKVVGGRSGVPHPRYSFRRTSEDEVT